MAAHFSHHSMITLAERAEQKATLVEIKSEPTEGAMTFQTFDICQVLQQGTVLVASGGQASLHMYYSKQPVPRRQAHAYACDAGV